MRKRVFGRKLSRERGTREALFRSLIRALVEHGRIITTKAKVKAIQSQVEKLVTKAKKNTVAARRAVLASLGNDKKTTDKIFNEIAPVFMERKGGYTRTVLLPERKGDRAPQARLEWVEKIEEKGPKKEQGKSKKTKSEVKKTKTK